MFKNKKTLFLCITAAALGTGVMLFNNDANADLFSQCPVQSGSTRFLDFETNRCGYVFGNNTNWGALPGDWNNRADQFGNDGVTHSNCLYDGFSCQGLPIFLPRGFTVTWRNTVSSNRWTTASSCPKSC